MGTALSLEYTTLPPSLATCSPPLTSGHARLQRAKVGGQDPGAPVLDSHSFLSFPGDLVSRPQLHLLLNGKFCN